MLADKADEVSADNPTGNDTFVAAAHNAYSKGWCPVSTGKPVKGKPPGKAPWLRRITGYSDADAKPKQFGKWPGIVGRMIEKSGDGILNLATRMPVGVVGIDIDDYTAPDGTVKHGLATLAEYEARFGPLPPTMRITARPFDTGSGIRCFRVPDEWAGPSELKRADGSKGDIELIQRHHRVAVLPPSLHHTGRCTTIYSERTGEECDLWAADTLPKLPKRWLIGIGHGNAPAGSRRPQANAAEVQAFVDKHTRERWPSMLRPIVEHTRAEPANTRNTMRDMLCQAAREARAGCYSFGRAVNQIRAAAEHSYTARGRALDDTDFDRSVAYAVAQAEAVAFVALRRRVARAHRFSSPETLRLAERALAPGGRWHPGRRDNDGLQASWVPVDVHAARLGRAAAPPSILARTDGACLFYRRKVHSVHGESESGKSWLVQCAAAETLLAGEPVLYVDFEDDAGPVAERLIRLGVPEQIVDNRALFTYIRPEASPYAPIEQAAFEAVLAQSFSLAVIDGVTDAMGLFGLSGKDNDDVAAWQRQLPRKIARATGAAVVCVDHVSKDADTRGRFALGGQHKMAGLDGAAFVVEMVQPFAVGLAGTASIRVGKDRPGQIRSLGGRWRKRDRTQLIADFRLDSTDTDRTTFVLDVPGPDTDDPTRGAVGAFRPTFCMEKVSRYLETTDDPEQRSTRRTVAALIDEHNEHGRPIGRDVWRAAIDTLAAEGFAEIVPGRRNSHLHAIVRPYREADDPHSGRYANPADAARKVRVRRATKRTEP